MPRGLWNGTLSFGLVAVPVRLLSATRDQDIHFHQVDERTGERIQVRRLCEADGKEVPWEEIGHGYDLDGQLVTLTDEELAAAAPERTHTIEIEQFVDLDAIDPAQFDHPYFLIPDSESGGATRAYQLLRDAMVKSNQVAIGRVVIRSNEYLVAVRERDDLLSLTTLLYADELRDAAEIDAIPDEESYAATRGEVTQVVKLIQAMTEDFDPDRYDDQHRMRLQALVDSKRKSGKVAAPEPAAGGKRTEVPDLMAALKQSLERAGK